MSIYVTNYSDNTVSKILAGTTTVAATITVGSPYGICTDPSGNVYVANYIANTVSKILAGTTTVAATITVGTNPYGICTDPSGNVLCQFLTGGM